MKLTKGKISKLYKKKKQSRQRIKKKKRSANNKTFRRHRGVNLANKTLKNYRGGAHNYCPSEGREPVDCNGDRTKYTEQVRIFHPDKNRNCKDDAKEKFKDLQNLPGCKNQESSTKTDEEIVRDDADADALQQELSSQKNAAAGEAAVEQALKQDKAKRTADEFASENPLTEEQQEIINISNKQQQQNQQAKTDDELEQEYKDKKELQELNAKKTLTPQELVRKNQLLGIKNVLGAETMASLPSVFGSFGRTLKNRGDMINQTLKNRASQLSNKASSLATNMVRNNPQVRAANAAVNVGTGAFTRLTGIASNVIGKVADTADYMLDGSSKKMTPPPESVEPLTEEDKILIDSTDTGTKLSQALDDLTVKDELIKKYRGENEEPIQAQPQGFPSPFKISATSNSTTNVNGDSEVDIMAQSINNILDTLTAKITRQVIASLSENMQDGFDSSQKAIATARLTPDNDIPVATAYPVPPGDGKGTFAELHH